MAIATEGSPGDHPPRWFIWEGPDKRGKFVEHVIFGYEAGINNSYAGWRRTGSPCIVDDVRESPVKDNEWFEYHIEVRDKRIVIKVNGKTMVDYTELEHPAHLKKYPHRLLKGGTFALQAHDPGSTVRFRNLRVRPLH